jgi:23S rRNA (cytosine1962-C5)-methyltransferase
LHELWLNRGADRRLRSGHCWVYSNEVDSARNRLGELTPGDAVTVRAANGAPLGSAYLDPHSLICARLYSHDPERPLDGELLAGRVRAALDLRERFFEQPCYRLLYGDSDALPGAVVDRFGEYLVVQLNNPGIEAHRAALTEALVATLAPRGILLRGDSRSRREAGLSADVELLHGEVPEQLSLQENGVRFEAPAWRGQKTGWFYDHRANRARLKDYVDGARVLDVYSYVGGWGVQAAAGGAASVCCVDRSEAALRCVERNAALNGVSDRVSCRRGSADEVMEQLAGRGEWFDLVILDPPAFVQRRRDLAKGRKAYRRINELALRLLKPGGVLFSASCSMLLSTDDLLTAVNGAAVRAGRRVQVLEFGGQSVDHPVHPAIPETRYLKSLVALVSPSGS